MQFGSVPANEIYAIDFSLRTEPAFNKQVLKGTPVKNPAVYIGCAKWEREEWLGKIYPTSTGKNELLTQYASHFNAIELNATHHKLYKESTIQKWLDKIAGKDFKFCPKMYKAVTHSGSLLHKEAVTDEFLHNILAFKDHLGPIFIQLSDTFSPGRKKELFNYLKTLPTGFQFFLELRHPGWFEKAVIREELFTALSEMNIGAVITDTAGRRECAHMYVTVPKVFIRYVGNKLHPTDYKRCHAWVERIKYWVENGLEESYFFIHDRDTSPELAVYLVDKINAAMGLDLKKPTFINAIPKQKGLFD